VSSLTQSIASFFKQIRKMLRTCFILSAVACLLFIFAPFRQTLQKLSIRMSSAADNMGNSLTMPYAGGVPFLGEWPEPVSKEFTPREEEGDAILVSSVHVVEKGSAGSWISRKMLRGGIFEAIENMDRRIRSREGDEVVALS